MTPSLVVVDVAAFDQFVDAGHQVFVVVAGIVVLDDVAEILAIARAAARVRIKHDVTLRRHPLKLVIEDVTVSRVRAAVDVQDERILFVRIKVGRLLHPRLTFLPSKLVYPDLFGLGEVEL